MRSIKRNGRKYECRESDCVRGRYAASFSANWDVLKLVCRIGGRLVWSASEFRTQPHVISAPSRCRLSCLAPRVLKIIHVALKHHSQFTPLLLLCCWGFWSPNSVSWDVHTYKCTQRSKIVSEKCTVLRSWPNDLWNSKESVPRPSTSCCAPFNVWEIWYFVESDAPHVCILRLNVRMCRQSDYKIYVSNRGGPLAILISKGSTKQGFLTTVLL